MPSKLIIRFDHEQGNMQTSKANQNFRSDDPVWVLVAESSLRDFLSDYDRREQPTAGYLFQSLRELGLSPECIGNIAETLAGFAKEASIRSKQGKLEFAGRIRIFCQKKILDYANSAKTSRPFHTESDKKQKVTFADSNANMIGGWGYFMIERGGDLPPDSSAIPHNDIDVYLYKEGD